MSSDDKKGMLRHVDILGRVVIPREVRKALHINYGDLMEFSACSDKQVVMRKFHLIREIAGLADSIVKVALLGRNCEILVIDTEKVVCRNGKKDLPQGDVTPELQEILNNREAVDRQSGFQVTTDLKLEKDCFIQSIVSGGDLLGGVIIANNDGISETHRDIADAIANFIADYFLNY